MYADGDAEQQPIKSVVFIIGKLSSAMLIATFTHNVNIFHVTGASAVVTASLT